MSHVGEYRFGGQPSTRPSHRPAQPMLTAAQIEAIRLSIGAHVSFAAAVEDPSLRATFTTAAVTLQGMLDDDAKAKDR